MPKIRTSTAPKSQPGMSKAGKGHVIQGNTRVGQKRAHDESQYRFPTDDSVWDNDFEGETEEIVGEYDPSEGFPSVSRQGSGAGASGGESKKRSKSGGFESMGFSYPGYKGIKQKG